MKRKLITILLAVSMILPLSACGNSSSTTSSYPNETTATTDDSKSEKSSKAPSEVTADNLTDFPVTDSSKLKNRPVSEGTDDLIILSFLGQNADEKDNVIVIPSEIDGKKVVQLGQDDGVKNYLIGTGAWTDYVDNLEAVVIPDSVENIVNLWYFTPKNMKYIVLPTKFENTGLEDRYDSNHQLTWIYKDVTN